jgi:Protein of unknown function (DUF3515)
MRRTSGARSAAVLGTLSVLLLAGCAGPVTMEPAPDANNPSCATVIVNLPEQLAGLTPRETDAQGTKAWGDPTSVRLRCGVPVPPPTAEFPCVTVDGVDWLRDAADEPVTVFTTYGRDPAVQVIIDGAVVGGEPVLSGLAGAVSQVPAERQCVDVTDVR